MLTVKKKNTECFLNVNDKNTVRLHEQVEMFIVSFLSTMVK